MTLFLWTQRWIYATLLGGIASRQDSWTASLIAAIVASQSVILMLWWVMCKPYISRWIGESGDGVCWCRISKRFCQPSMMTSCSSSGSPWRSWPSMKACSSESALTPSLMRSSKSRYRKVGKDVVEMHQSFQKGDLGQSLSTKPTSNSGRYSTAGRLVCGIRLRQGTPVGSSYRFQLTASNRVSKLLSRVTEQRSEAAASAAWNSSICQSFGTAKGWLRLNRQS